MSTLLKSKFTIDRENVGLALTDLQAWNEAWPSRTAPYQDIKDAKTLIDAVHYIGFDLVEDRFGNIAAIQQHDNDVDADWYETAMSSMTDWIDSGSYMLFIGDEEDFYCWRWQKVYGEGKFQCYSGGVVVFPDQVEQLTEKFAQILRTYE